MRSKDCIGFRIAHKRSPLTSEPCLREGFSLCRYMPCHLLRLLVLAGGTDLVHAGSEELGVKRWVELVSAQLGAFISREAAGEDRGRLLGWVRPGIALVRVGRLRSDEAAYLVFAGPRIPDPRGACTQDRLLGWQLAGDGRQRGLRKLRDLRNRRKRSSRLDRQQEKW